MPTPDSIEALANHTSLVLAEHGITGPTEGSLDDPEQTRRFFWSPNDEIGVTVVDGSFVLSIAFDPVDPQLNSGYIYSTETNQETGVDPEQMRGFATYLMSLLGAKPAA